MSAIWAIFLLVTLAGQLVGQEREPASPVCEAPKETFFAGPISHNGPLPDKVDKLSPSLYASIERHGILPLLFTFYNVHTKESLPVFANPKPDKTLLRYFFRSRGYGQTKDLDERLFEAVAAGARFFKEPRVEVISGYRSPKFNEILAKKGRHVALRSKHLIGGAVDVRFSTVDAGTLGKWFRLHYEGGVGIYLQDNFVHLDIGAKRSWMGH